MLFEYRGHIHIHTRYSDGGMSHSGVALAALGSDLDYVITTDHNVWVDGVEGYYGERNSGRVLLLVGEEIHNVGSQSQVTHSLALGADAELAPYARDPRQLIAAARAAGGFCFLAHPFGTPSNGILEWEPKPPDWVDWGETGYAGLEIWNYRGEIAGQLASGPAALRTMPRSPRAITAPYKETVDKWDELLAAGHRVACIAGGDVHAGSRQAGPAGRTDSAYRAQFAALNTYVLTSKPLTGELERDKELLLAAIKKGNSWIGHDAAGAASGFRFTAQGEKQHAIMGDELGIRRGAVTLQASTPQPAHIRLIRDGETAAESTGSASLVHHTDQSGAYRVEAYIYHARRKRGWIFSNPIYLVRET